FAAEHRGAEHAHDLGVSVAKIRRGVCVDTERGLEHQVLVVAAKLVRRPVRGAVVVSVDGYGQRVTVVDTFVACAGAERAPEAAAGGEGGDDDGPASGGLGEGDVVDANLHRVGEPALPGVDDGGGARDGVEGPRANQDRGHDSSPCGPVSVPAHWLAS